MIGNRIEEKKVGIIILNYENYTETEVCVKSILKQKYTNYHILIVDNGSDNESYRYLKQKYQKEMKVSVIRARKNYGFAKGNNIGIQYARDHLDSDFILLLNSDTVLTDDEYINILISQYKTNVGVIGSEITLRNKRKQKLYREYINFPETLFYYLKLWNQLYGISIWDKYIEKILNKKNKVSVLHGSAMLLTPAYFEKYSGLYSKTFLYTEEILLFIMCRRAGLKQVYTSQTQIFHKEDQSSKHLYANKSSDKLKYLLNSYKYVVWESFKDYIKKAKRKGK